MYVCVTCVCMCDKFMLSCIIEILIKIEPPYEKAKQNDLQPAKIRSGETPV